MTVKILAIVFLLALLSVCCAVLPIEGKVIRSVSGESTGGHSSIYEVQSTDADIINVFGETAGKTLEMTLGHQSVSGPGKTSVISETTLDGTLTDSTTISATGELAVWDSAATNSLVPNESEIACEAGALAIAGVDTSITGAYPTHVTSVGMTGAQGPAGTYTSDKTMTPNVYALSGSYNGTGVYHAALDEVSEAGNDKDAPNRNHVDSAYIRDTFYSNDTGGINTTTDYAVGLGEFPDTLNLTDEECLNITEGDNLSPIANISFSEEE